MHLNKLIFAIKPRGEGNNHLVSCVSWLCSLVGSMRDEQGWFFHQHRAQQVLNQAFIKIAVSYFPHRSFLQSWTHTGFL